MTVTAPASPPALPPAVSGERRELMTASGRLAYYANVPVVRAAAGTARPLLLIHSVNAAGSAYEVKPLYEHYAATRPVYAVELPGFGASERGNRAYSPRLMTDAVLAMTAEITRLHGHAGGTAPSKAAAQDGASRSAETIDALAVSLGSEFLARAATEQPALFRSVALVSPTGFDRRAPFDGPPGSDRGMAWLYRTFTAPFWTRGIWRTLTRPGTIRFFLNKTWGSKNIDEAMLAYDVLTTRQPGARHAPFRFVSGYLFSGDITRVYQSLQQPVWMVHGVRGDFVDYRYKAAFAGRPNWSFTVLQTGALPHFELPGDFIAAYDTFLAGLPAARQPSP